MFRPRNDSTGPARAESSAATMPCAICGSHDFAVALEHHGRVMTSDRRVVEGVLAKERCRACGAVRSRPSSSGLDLPRFYMSEYEQNSEPHKHTYVTEHGIVPRSRVEWEAVKRLRAPQEGERWLEIGCGAGDVLVHLTEEGPRVQAVGMELSKRAAELARRRGLDVTQGGLDAAPGAFDVIFAIGVLEHVPDPRRFVTAAAARLESGGALILALPDLGTPSFDAWFVDHLHHFSAAHVQRLCVDAGLGSFVDGWRPPQTPHFMYLRAEAEGDSPPLPFPTDAPSCIGQWQAALGLVADVFRRYSRVGFLGASETAAFLLTYAPVDGSQRPLLFDDTCSAPTTRFGCELLPGAELDRQPCPVDAVVVATVPAYYEVLRTSRLRHLQVPTLYPLEPGK
jgi:SAM-dependent methyltransferase